MSRLGIDEGNGYAAANDIVGFDCHLRLDRIEDLTLSERIVWMDSLQVVSYLTNFNDSQAGRAVLSNQVFGNISWNRVLEHQVVLILLEDDPRILNEAIAQLSPAVAANQIELQRLSFLIGQSVF